MNYSRIIVIWLISCMLPGNLFSQVYTERIERSFKTSPTIEVDVTNKYGMVHVETWHKDSVKVSIDMRIEAATQEKLKNVQNSVEFNFSPSKYKIKVNTTFTKARGLITEFVDAFVPSNQVIIDYTIMVPEKASVTINNKFGNIFIDDIKGKVDATLSNGILTANTISGDVVFKISSGDCQVDNLNKGTIYLSYGDLNLGQVNDLTIDSRSSNVNIDFAKHLTINSSRDKYNISQSDNLFCEGSITSLKIDNLENEINATLKYGGVNIDNVSRTFKFMNLESEYADIDLLFERGANYNLDITHHEDTQLRLPKEFHKTETKTLNPDEKLLITYGTVGNNVNTSSPKLKISAIKKCIVNIIHK